MRDYWRDWLNERGDLMDASFYEEAIRKIECSIQTQKEVCTKHGYTPEYIRGYIKGLEEALMLLKAKAPKFTKEGYI
jgi:hypothetical protein